MWTLLVLISSVAAEVINETPAAGDARRLEALHCPPCERVHCSTRRALRLQCEGGITTGVCGCCPVCAKTEGETCGGTWDYLGKCDAGLICVYQDTEDDTSDAERTGVCKSVIKELKPDTCMPECTKEFCQSNPFGVCSARSTSLEKKDCQGPCQHTSCSSCFLLNRPSCPHTCSPTDAACLHRFGKCVHNYLRLRSHVCHSDLQNTSDGQFVCLVPGCANCPD